MADYIEYPPMLQGDESAQLQQMYRYLYQLSESLNINLRSIGGNDLSDSERVVINKILGNEEGEAGNALGTAEMETLKSLIIKTAEFVQTSLQEYKTSLISESVTKGQFGKYVRKTKLDVDVNPEGITQKYSFESVVQGLKTYSINAKNYIKTGLLRTVSSIPVYGVAIGKDVVTFSQDGTETYNDGNKVAELTAEELSFWQNSVKIAGYTGSRISFYYGGVEKFYIYNGKWYAAGDVEITSGKKLTLASGADMDVASGANLNVWSGGDINVKSGGNLNVNSGGNIDINGTGNLKLSGSTVEIKSGSTFDVDSTNMRIDSSRGVFVTKSPNSMIHNDLVFAIGNYFNDNDNYVVNILPVQATIIDTYGNTKYTYPLSLDIIDKVTIQNKEYEISMLLGMYYDYDPESDNADQNYYPEVQFGALSSTDGINYNIEKVNLICDRGVFQFLKTDKIKGNEARLTTVYYTNLIQNSSKDIKHEIQPMISMGEKLDQLKPVTFVYDNDENEKQRMGLIYEDTVEVMPEICTDDESNKAINYVELIPALLKEIQELRARVKALEEREEERNG